MSTYRYAIVDLTNLITKITAITTRINIDPEINPANLPVLSVIYVAPNIEITFTLPLVGREFDIVGRMIRCVFYGESAGEAFDYNNQIGTSRDIVTTVISPTVQYDLDAGYNTGSQVFLPSASSIYFCLDPTVDSAQWVKLSNVSTIVSRVFSSYGSLLKDDYIGQGDSSSNFTDVAIISGIDGFLTNLKFSIRDFANKTNIIATVWIQPDGGSPSATSLTATIADGNVSMSATTTGASIAISSLDIISIQVTWTSPIIIIPDLLNSGVTSSVDILG